MSSRHFRWTFSAATAVRAVVLVLACLGDEGASGQSAEIRVSPGMELSGEVWSNQAGGQRYGTLWNGQMLAHLEVLRRDEEAEATDAFFLSVLGVTNQSSERCFSEYVGAFSPVSGIQAGDALRVHSLFYSRAWKAGALEIRAGQMALDDDFMGSEYAGHFANSAFGAMSSQVGTPLSCLCGNASAFPVFPLASPAVFVRKSSGSLSIQTALYYGGPGLDRPGNRGFDYVDGAGLVAAVEFVSRSRFLGRSGAIRLGVLGHTGHFDDFRLLNAGVKDASCRGLYSVYAVQDLVLAAGRDGEPALACFWRAGLCPPVARAVVVSSFDAGFVWFGPFAARPADSLGLAFASTQFGSDYRTYVGRSRWAASERTLEFYYRCGLLENLCVQADLQWLLRPAMRSPEGRQASALALAMRTHLSF